jgi:antitoxin (DNA-binding transcriptional repressor) of toxin-antitoxin stability system
LRAAERGEQIRVTVRGRAVADLVAAGNHPLRELVAAGRVVAPARTRPTPEPRLVQRQTSASELDRRALKRLMPEAID